MSTRHETLNKYNNYLPIDMVLIELAPLAVGGAVDINLSFGSGRLGNRKDLVITSSPYN